MSGPNACNVKVVVIGAGIAGMTAAAKLIHNGVDDVIVLEAQDYIGGRIKAAYQDGKVLDLGAQFIHGREGNPIFEIADKLNRVAFPDNEDAYTNIYNNTEILYASNGKTIPRAEVDTLLGTLRRALCVTNSDENIDGILDNTKDKWRKYGENGNAKQPVMEAYEEFIRSNQPITAEKQELYDAVLRWNTKFECTDNAVADLSQLSLGLFCEYIDLPGDRYTDVKGGMAGIMETIANLVPGNKDIVRLNCPVVKINWNATQDITQISKPVRVTCENGDVIEADHVIVTMSVGCLKAHHQKMFEPQLPEPTQQLIERTGFGGIGKVFLFWQEPFWNAFRRNDQDNYFESFELLWLDSHIPDIPSDRSKVKTKMGKPWWYGIFALETVYDHPNCLELWLTHEQAEVSEALDDGEVMNVLTDVIRAFLTEMDVPDPVAMYRTNWLTNPFVRGTYSHYSTEMRQVDLENMGKPIPSDNDPRLLFAGESFCREYLSAAHGAFISGSRQADQILARHGLSVEKDILDLIPSTGGKISNVLNNNGVFNPSNSKE